MTTRQTLSAAMTLALVAGSAMAQVGFNSPVTYQAPSTPDGVASADFDRDGDVDLAVVTDSPARITLFLNNYGQGFAAPVYIPLPAGSAPNFVRAADMNQDGIADLVVVLKNTAQVAILINDGHAGFTVGATIPVGNNPRWFIVGPLHGGTSNDIIVANRADGTVTVLLQQTGLTFTSSTYPVGADPRGITRFDVTGDGFPELFVTSYANRNFVRLTNDGAGHFTQGGSILVGADRRPNGIFASDLNADGKTDIIIANASDTGQGFATVFLNNNNTFPASASYPTLGLNPGQVLAADLDRDGKMDLAVVNPDSNSISTLRNTGNGVFATAQTFTVGASPRVMAIADLDLDLIPDIAVSNMNGGTISVMLNSQPSLPCYANFDNSSVPPILNANDFLDFMTAYTFGQSTANCDGSTSAPVLNANDFSCFLNKFAAGCS